MKVAVGEFAVTSVWQDNLATCIALMQERYH